MKRFLFTVIFIVPVFLFAQTGFLDKPFGDHGKVLTPTAGYCYSVALQTDGKIIAAGNGINKSDTGGFLIRYLPGGSIDESFSKQGKVVLNLDDYYVASFYAVAVLPDDKIIAAGTAEFINGAQNSNVIVARYLTDGTLDSSFGTNGTGVNNFNRLDNVNSILVQTDGKILVAGSTRQDAFSSINALMMRYLPNGSLDESFGDHGQVITVLSSSSQIFSLAIQSDNKIIAAGSYGIATSQQFLTMRYATNGNIDSTYGLNGIKRPDFGPGGDIIYDIALQGDGKILATGVTNDGFTINQYMAVVRYENNGGIDSNFGTDGKLTISFNKALSEGKRIMLQEDNKIIVAGHDFDELKIQSDFALVRLQPDGTIDSTFGTNGKTTTNFGNWALVRDMQLQEDGKILLAGDIYLGIDNYALARYNNDEVMPLHFTYFNASPTNNGGITLNWQTAQENNNEYFSVERSGDSRFRGNDGGESEIARINSKGNSSQLQSYSYTDNAPLQGTNFYRLQQVDKDGRFSYSQIVSATIQNGLTVVLYPNPVKDVLNIKGLDVGMSYELSVMSAKGNVVAQTSINNTSSYLWNLQRLSKGLYYLNVTSANKKTTVKFVKE